ncbi:MAG TPA: aldolase/citrate lyase family protein, partial [Solirubrobacteraceae bacterium]|nr:aldolase/citrate lyase family protein [Solirubrobacteraceae bacterium]
MPEPPPLIRSYLYAPGSNPAVMEKAVRAGADAVIFDLEDSVAVSDKSAARDEVAAMIARVSGDAGSLEVLVRVNRGPDGVSGDDVAAVVRPGLTGLRVPKVGSAAELDALAGLLDDLEARAGMPPGAVRIYPVIETAAAVLCVGELAAAPRVARLGFGATDFLADIGAPGAG